MPPDNSDTSNLSGAAWWHSNQAKFPNVASLGGLDNGFRAKVEEFLAALRAATIQVDISSTRRNQHRAYLMHYSWDVANGFTQPAEVPLDSEVNIIWDHGNLQDSMGAAKEMVALFGLVHEAALNSRHIQGLAIDMNLTWRGTVRIRNKRGEMVEIDDRIAAAKNLPLHSVGASYSVFKLLSDAPHWSADGH